MKEKADIVRAVALDVLKSLAARCRDPGQYIGMPTIREVASLHGITLAELEADEYTVQNIKLEQALYIPQAYAIRCGDKEWSAGEDKWVSRGHGFAGGKTTADAIANYLRATSNVPGAAGSTPGA
ncbi:MAG: hypothetical protein L6Q35_00450 [Phycisphaerales bacterium]|nr:hypothetical protein [Phycisphaerales bacterium]